MSSKPLHPSSSTLVVLCLVAVGCGTAAPPPSEQPPAAPPPLTPAKATTEPAAAPPAAPPADLEPLAADFHEFFLHDECTGPFPPQPDTCAHLRKHEKSFTFGGTSGTVYDVTLRVRGIFEPTTIEGGETPDPAHPYFKAGGTVKTTDWSYWHIDVSEPKQTYYLNNYPSVSHIIHKQDFQATIPVAGGATVVVRVIDGNDRQIDNGKKGPDRERVIEGVVDKPLAGQMLRLDVVGVKAR
jgi:hypothetical protein